MAPSPFFPRGALRYREGGEFGLIIGQPVFRHDFASDEAMVDEVEKRMRRLWEQHKTVQPPLGSPAVTHAEPTITTTTDSKHRAAS